jgi:hypothetical protein
MPPSAHGVIQRVAFGGNASRFLLPQPLARGSSSPLTHGYQLLTEQRHDHRGCECEAMFDTILLLTDYLVEQPFLSAWLLENNPCLTIISVLTSVQICDLDPDIFRRALLIAFTASSIVPRAILTQLGYGAYNFHLGPPKYPGWRPGRFALLDGSTEFGVTVHSMVKEIDAGPIIQVSRFKMALGDRVAVIEV